METRCRRAGPADSPRPSGALALCHSPGCPVGQNSAPWHGRSPSRRGPAGDERAGGGLRVRGRGHRRARESGPLARWMARFSIDRSLRPGTYFIRRFPWEVRQLEAAKSATISVTIVPGTDLYPARVSPGTLTKDQAEKLLMTDELYPKEMIPLLPTLRRGASPSSSQRRTTWRKTR